MHSIDLTIKLLVQSGPLGAVSSEITSTHALLNHQLKNPATAKAAIVTQLCLCIASICKGDKITPEDFFNSYRPVIIAMLEAMQISNGIDPNQFFNVVNPTSN